MKAILLAISILTLSACTTNRSVHYPVNYNPIGDVMPAPMDCNTDSGVCG